MQIDDLVQSIFSDNNPDIRINEYRNKHDLSIGDFYAQLANRLNEVGMTRLAIAYYHKAVNHKSTDLVLLRKFIPLLELCGHINEAITVSRKVTTLCPQQLKDHYVLAGLLLKQGQTNEAIAVYTKLVSNYPNLPELLIRIGNVHKVIGDLENEVSYYNKALELNPNHAWALASRLAINKPIRRNDECIRKIEKLLGSTALSESKRITLSFGLGKAYEQLAAYDDAMRNFKIANSLRRKELPAFDHELFEKKIANCITAFDSEFIRSAQNAKSGSDMKPIFIVGLPRSGTTLVEQIISAHSSVVGGGELTDMNFLIGQIRRRAAFKGESFPGYIKSLQTKEVSTLAKEYLNAVQQRLKNPVCFTDKLPHNFVHLGLIHALFPYAKIIHCKRNPMDTCLSIYKNNFASYHDYAYDLEEIARHYQSYEKVMKHWKGLMPTSIYEVEYEALINSPEKEINQLLTYCQLENESACFDFHMNRRMVNTLSTTQVRQPIYDHSIALWKKYKTHLNPLTKALQACSHQPAKVL